MKAFSNRCQDLCKGELVAKIAKDCRALISSLNIQHRARIETKTRQFYFNQSVIFSLPMTPVVGWLKYPHYNYFEVHSNPRAFFWDIEKCLKSISMEENYFLPTRAPYIWTWPVFVNLWWFCVAMQRSAAPIVGGKTRFVGLDPISDFQTPYH